MNKQICNQQIKKYQSLIGTTFKHRNTDVTIVIDSLICQPSTPENENEYQIYVNYYSSASFRKTIMAIDSLADVFQNFDLGLDSL
jgi:hypothetical protein